MPDRRDKCLFSAERVEGSKEELIARCIRIDLYQEFRDKCKEFSMKELRSQCAAAGVSADDVLDAFDTDEPSTRLIELLTTRWEKDNPKAAQEILLRALLKNQELRGDRSAVDPKTGEASALAKAGAPPGDTANFLIKERATIDDIPKQIEGYEILTEI